jgi:hypothetical protein
VRENDSYDRNPIRLNPIMIPTLRFWHDRCGKPVSTLRQDRPKVPDHAPAAVEQSAGRQTAAQNLPLAAHRRVRHIGATGDVAEWLKAAVC